MRKILFVLLLLFPLTFAAWQTVAAMAILVSGFLLITIFMIGYGMQNEQMKVIAKDEFYQLIALAVMIVILFGADGLLNGISQNVALTQGHPTLQEAAIASLQDIFDTLSDYLSTLASTDNKIAREAAKATSCSFAGGGYSVSACGGFTMMQAPFSLAGSIAGFAIAEVSAIKMLTQLAMDYALVLLLPLGIILRTFKFSRGAGGFLIALGISAFILMPLGIIFVGMLNQQFEESVYATDDYTEEPSVVGRECNPEETFGNDNIRAAKNTYHDLREELNKYIYVVLLRATLTAIAALLFFIGGLKALSAAFGAEIDVSAISRFF